MYRDTVGLRASGDRVGERIARNNDRYAIARFRVTEKSNTFVRYARAGSTRAERVFSRVNSTRPDVTHVIILYDTARRCGRTARVYGMDNKTPKPERVRRFAR